MKKIISLLAIGLFAVAASTSAATFTHAQLVALGFTETQATLLLPMLNGSGTTTGSTTATAGTGYTHISTLRVGSRGPQVTELQTCLNALGNNTGVADGVFGPNTKAGVKSFQAENGLAVDGIIGQMTGPKFEAACATSGGTTTGGGNTNETVTGDKLVISGVASDDLFVGPSQKVVFTELTLSAGDKDVMVKDIIVEVTGSADSNVIEKVMILDSAMVEIENDNVNSDDEAKIDVDLEVKDGESVTLYVAAVIQDNTPANITASDGLDVSLKVISVVTDGADVEGTPIDGASHTVKDNITVDNFDADITKDESAPKVGETEVKLATVNVDNSTNDNQMLKSLKLFRTGNAGDDALENVEISADGKTYKATQDDDEYTFDFGDGIEIADGDDLDLEVMADIEEDDTQTVGFDIMDITVLDADGIILVDLTGTFAGGTGTADWTYGSTATIGTSTVVVGKTSDVGDEKIAASTDGAELASFDVDVDGEWVEADVDVVITLDTSSVSPAVTDWSDVDLDNIALYVDGSKVSDMEDASWTADGAMTVTFDAVKFTDEGAPVDYVIKGDIKRDAPSKTEYTITSVQLTNVETKSGENVGPFPAAAKTINVTQEVEGSAVTGQVVAPSPATVTNDNSVGDNGSEQIVAEIEIDAADSGDDIKVLEVKFDIVIAGTGTVADVTNCTLDESSDSEDAGTSMVYGLDLDITKDTKKTLMVKCDIGSGTDATTTVTINNLTFDAEGVTTTTKFNNEAGTGTSLVAVSVSTLAVKLDTDTPDAFVAMEGGSYIEIARMEVQADDGDVKIATLMAELSEFDVVENGKVKIYVDGTYEGDVVLTADATAVMSDTLNVTVTDGNKAEIVFKATMVSDATVPAVKTTALTVSAVTLSDGTAATGTPLAFNGVTITDAMPVTTLTDNDTITMTTSSISDETLMVFKIEADGGDVQVTDLGALIGGTIVATNSDVKVYSDAALTNLVQEDLNIAGGFDGTVDITDVTITEGDTYFFVLEADLAASAGQNATLTIADAITGITFGSGLDSSLVMEDEFKTTVNTTL